MSHFAYTQVLSNLVLNSNNEEKNNELINEFNSNEDFIELRLKNYPISSAESEFIKQYIYPIVTSGLVFLFTSLFIFLNGTVIRNLRKYAIYLSWGARTIEKIVALIIPFLVIILWSLPTVLILVDFVYFSPLRPSFVLMVYLLLIIIYTLLSIIVIRSSTIQEFYK